MSVTPQGPISVAIAGLQTLIANLPSFQAWVGAENADEALASIFVGDVGFPIASIVIAGGVATVQTRDPHNLAADQQITIAGSSLGPESGIDMDGVQTITSVTPCAFTCAVALPDQEITYGDQTFVLPCVRPIAVIAPSNESVRATAVGTGGASIFAGQLEILLEADVSAAYQNDPINSMYEANNAVGQFVQDLLLYSDTGDLMVLNQAEPISAPDFTHRAEQDDNTVRYERWRALVKATWGLQG